MAIFIPPPGPFCAQSWFKRADGIHGNFNVSKGRKAHTGRSMVVQRGHCGACWGGDCRCPWRRGRLRTSNSQSKAKRRINNSILELDCCKLTDFLPASTGMVLVIIIHLSRSILHARTKLPSAKLYVIRYKKLISSIDTWRALSRMSRPTLKEEVRLS